MNRRKKKHLFMNILHTPCGWNARVCTENERKNLFFLFNVCKIKFSSTQPLQKVPTYRKINHCVLYLPTLKNAHAYFRFTLIRSCNRLYTAVFIQMCLDSFSLHIGHKYMYTYIYIYVYIYNIYIRELLNWPTCKFLTLTPPKPTPNN